MIVTSILFSKANRVLSMHKFLLNSFIALISSAAVVGCGGGGGDNPTPTPENNTVSLSSGNTFADTATDSAVNTLPCFKGSSTA